MGPFSLLSILGAIWPRLVKLMLVVAFVAFRHDAIAAFWWAVHVEAAHSTSVLASMLKHAGVGMASGCHANSVRCPR